MICGYCKQDALRTYRVDDDVWACRACAWAWAEAPQEVSMVIYLACCAAFTLGFLFAALFHQGDHA